MSSWQPVKKHFRSTGKTGARALGQPVSGTLLCGALLTLMFSLPTSALAMGDYAHLRLVMIARLEETNQVGCQGDCDSQNSKFAP